MMELRIALGILLVGGIVFGVPYLIIRLALWLGLKKSLIVGAVLFCISFVVAQIFLPTKEEEFERFTGFEVPADAQEFRYRTSGYDQFMDHDGVFSFVASEKTLEKLADQKFRGEFEWHPSTDFRMYFLNCKPYQDELVKGSINLDAGTFTLEYSTW